MTAKSSNGWDQREVPLPLQGQAHVEHVPFRLDDHAAVALGRLNLGLQGRGRHHDGGFGPDSRGPVGESGGVVPGR
jgi:hypothetical protein